MSADITARCPGCGVEFNASDVAGMAACPVCNRPFPAAAEEKPTEPAAPQATPAARPAPPPPVAANDAAPETRKRRGLTFLALAGLLYLASTQVTLFVVQPIGAVPEGRTLLISRLNKTNFIDSADAMCERLQGGVSLLCRGATMAAVAKNADILARLPYSDTLYLISTGGKRYEK